MKFTQTLLYLLFLTVVSGRSLSFEESNETPSTTRGSFDPCGICKRTIAFLDGGVKYKHTRVSQLGDMLDSICENLVGAAAIACKNYVGTVIGLYVYVYTSAEESLENFCESTFQCAPGSSQIVTENGIVERTCEVCKRTMTSFVKTMSSEGITALTARFITVFCTGPGRILGKEECAKQSVRYWETTYGRTEKLLRPEVFCTFTRICPKSAFGPEAETPIGAEELGTSIEVLMT
eukprot:g3668.t1